MATRNNETSKIDLKFMPTDGDGKQTTVRRTIQHINPAASDDDVYAFAQSLAGLQNYPLASVSRTNAAALAATAA